MYKWKMNDLVTIDLPEPTEEALEKFLSDTITTIFMPFDSKDIIRERFKEHLKELKDNGTKTETIHNSNRGKGK